MSPSVVHPPVAGPDDPTKQVSKTVYEAAHTLTDVASAADVVAHAAAADPHVGYQKESEKGAASGYASLGTDGLVPVTQLPSSTGIPVSRYKSYTLSPAPNLNGDTAGPQTSTTGANPWAAVGGGKLTDGLKGAGTYNDSITCSWQNTTDPMVFRIDLGAAMALTLIRIWGLCNNGNIYTPNIMKVEYSDNDTAWTVVENRTGLAAVTTGGFWFADFTVSGSHRYWRVSFTRNNANLALTEIECF